MKTEAKITGKRQITIPKEVYSEMNLQLTDKVIFTKNENGEIIISKNENNPLDICPICNREVLNTDTMLVKEFQRYHFECCNLSDNANDFIDDKCISNKLTTSQSETIKRVDSFIKKTKLDLIKGLGDNECVLMVPIKVTFSENKPGIIGMISEFKSDDIFKLNFNISK